MSFKKRKNKPQAGKSGKPGKSAIKQGKGGGRAISGRLSVHRDGFGFVAPETGGDDIFIPARYLRENLHGDTVEVELERGGRGGKREGRIVATKERGVTTVIGYYRRGKNGHLVQPDDTRLPWLSIHKPAVDGLLEGDVVLTEIIAYPTDRQPAQGKIIERLGSPDDPEVEVLMIIRKFDLPHSFPDKVLKYAKGVSQSLSEADLSGRTDLRSLTTVTIDGETARDFDDAVSIRREGNNVRLWVSIADVAHYVTPGSVLDKEAYLRGTSVYFPDRCIPMLPEELSNGICSLNPRVDRLTMTAEMLFDQNAAMLSADFYPSVINSNARLTYTIVSRIIEHDDPDAKGEYPELVADLKTMQELALALAAMRHKRWSIDFDLPEAEILLAESGRPEAIRKAERNQAHKLIESFMLAANEAVALKLAEETPGSIYRIHELPDQERLGVIAEFFARLGYPELLEAGAIKPADIQQLLAHLEGKPEERLINRMLLRSMKQARYAAENLGHFGLAAPCYTHFTSPIRRYPDLIVHRILKWFLGAGKSESSRGKLTGTPFSGYPACLPDMGEHTSRRERVAMEAERDVVELMKIRFMEDKVGEEFDGFIGGVTQFGLFVELDELLVEGLVHISTLPEDIYTYIETEQTLIAGHSGQRYRIGDAVRVKLASVSRERRQIDFALASLPPAAGQPAEQYQRVPVKGKKPQGWGKGGKKGAEKGGGGRAR